MATASWNARTEAAFAAKLSPASVLATTTPITETPTRPATRATALLTADAIPASLSFASAITVAVSGATVIDSPSEKTSKPGSRSRTKEACMPMRRKRSTPPAPIRGPAAMKSLGP